MKLSMLCFPMRDNEILLAMKKRSFGAGLWNGSGGKVNSGETLEQATVREAHEEIGIAIEEKDLESMGMLHFRSVNERFNWDTAIFFVRRWNGDPAESEEMRPQWFPKNALPFDTMWPDDRHWFPYVLSGKKIEATFEFDADGKNIIRSDIKEIH